MAGFFAYFGVVLAAGAAELKVAEGFKVEKLRDLAQGEGSWVAMTVDAKGRLIGADQYGGLYRLDPAGDMTPVKLVLPLGGAHGVLWHQGALYVTVNESVGNPEGVYVVRDMDEDGELETVTQLKGFRGRGEHGPHALVASPDGAWIYVVAGNHTGVPEINRGPVFPGWGEDHLLPRMPDPRGHAVNCMAPGGWIARFRPDGKDWELVSTGYRNAYDIAFNDQGELFAYDADMEWDFGMPWYRPTRICHAFPGSEFGWRNGSGKWPEYYEDSMSAVVDIGPGSPTGLVSGRGAKFPERYQRALYAFDWTFGTVYAIHLQKKGRGYSATKEEMVAGPGMPLTDAVVGADGAMYFLTGGRRTASALWRLTYVGAESTAPVAYAEALSAPMTVEEAKAALGSADRTERQMARVVLETSGVTELPGGSAWADIGAAIIDARAKRAAQAFERLGKIDWNALDRDQKVAWLRAAGIAFVRAEKADPAWRGMVLGKIDASFPATDDRLNRELCVVLSYLRAPGVVGRALGLMDAAGPEPAPDWAELITRNSHYGPGIKRMMENQPPSQVIHYLACLRVVEGPWQEQERARYFEWIKRLKNRHGGMSYGGFLDRIREDALASATPEERKRIGDLPPPRDPFANLPPVKGPGRPWTVEEIVAVGSKGDFDREHGRKMFEASLCAACHSVGGQGGAAGPDLTTVAGRFSLHDLAVALVDPSAEVSDQYSFEVFSKEDGSQVIGKQVDEKDEKMIIAINPFDFSQRTEVVRSEMKERRKSPVSPMPPGLINRLNEKELRDLLGYLMGK
ncbi:MAG: c-type cytochrome [Akkermansiaceae bacterium]|nr:c-type cytochrome [Akkermansiaceae bacterium]